MGVASPKSIAIASAILQKQQGIATHFKQINRERLRRGALTFAIAIGENCAILVHSDCGMFVF